MLYPVGHTPSNPSVEEPAQVTDQEQGPEAQAQEPQAAPIHLRPPYMHGFVFDPETGIATCKAVPWN